jgi:hypothetical protein
VYATVSGHTKKRGASDTLLTVALDGAETQAVARRGNRALFAKMEKYSVFDAAEDFR